MRHRIRSRNKIPLGYLTPAEVRLSIPGLDRDTLLRWTESKYVEAVRGKIGKMPAFLYPSSEIEKLRQMKNLVDKGYAPRKAYEMSKLGTTERLPFDETENAYQGKVYQKLKSILESGHPVAKFVTDTIEFAYSLTSKERRQ